MPESWKALFLESIEKLLSKSTHDLQTLISEVSSCAIVTMLLRLLANTEIVAQGHQLLAHLVQKVLYLSDIASEDFQPDPTNERTNSLFYTMAGDRMGSYFLETLFEVAPWEMFMNLLNQFAVLSTAETFLDYAKDASGNFIIQAIIKRLAAESPRSRKVARQALELALAAPPATAQEILLRRPMVFYWLLEATLKVKDEELALQAAEMVWNAWAEKESGVSDEEVAAFLSKTFEVLPTGPKDIKSQPQNKGKGKDKGKPEDGNEAAEEENAGRGPSDAYQVSAAKIVGATLRSSGAVRGRAGHILTLLSVPALHNIAITGALAKAILDVFFELFPGNVDLKLVGQKLASSACNLAVHFAGQHVLRKAFEASDLRGKEKWVTVLVAEKERLARSKEGRSALQIVRAELFERSAQDWRAAMKKDLKSHDVKPSKGEGKRAREESAPQAPQRGEEAAVQREAEEGEEPGDAEGEDGAAGAGKRKRKRRRAAKAE